MKKGIFCHNKSITMTPKLCAHMCTTSLWGVTAKWPTQAPKIKLILGLRDPQGYSCISLSLSCRILKEYQNIVSEAELPELANGLVSKPFSSPQMIVYQSAFCIAMSWLKCLVWSMLFLFLFLSATWSNITDPWQNFSEAEFHIFLCTTIEIIVI